MRTDETSVQCVRCGSPAGGVARRGVVCPGCLLAEGMEQPADVNWVRDRFPQLAEVEPAPGGEGRGKEETRVFEARDFESGAAVLLSLWRLEAGAAARQLADLERRACLAHPGIARVLDFGEVDDWLYAIEERPAGQRLREAISVAEVSRGDMLRLLPEISAAVRYAAEQGVSIGAEPDTVFITGEGRVTLSGVPGATPVSPGSGVAWVEFHPAVGRRVGRYELLELIGEGGFAEVYRAQEERPVRREVALKILKPGMDTRQILARFARERQALAMMSHGGIATIFDAGATESGRPWIAMELVVGKPLTAFCDERRMPLRERAALLATICRAVHHGHEKGVVHRDLKSSKILIAEQDGAPVAKVIDFGIATAATEPAGGGTFFTRTQQFLGSPCYMSPEQVNGGDVDGRSDVYSLGAVLYQLLTGEPPLTETAVKDCGIREVIESVQRQEAEHPADRVAGFSDQRRAAVAQARGLNPLELTRALSGELSGIALKALSKNAAERYDTAAALGEDLENWVRGQPVSASIPRRRAARRALAALRWAAVFALIALGAAWLWNQKPLASSGPEAPAWAVRHPVRSRAADGSIKPVALFQFDGDLRSGIAGGPDLTAIGAPALTFASANIRDGVAEVLQAPRFLPSQWLKCPNVIGINGPPDATESNDWTLVFDVMFPSITGPVGLFQCDSENRAVAELYVGPGGLGDTEFGLQYGRIREGEWYRIVVVSSHSDRSQLYATWVNGARWGVPHVRGMNSAQFAFDDALLFFCEGNQRTGGFYVNSLAVYDVPLADHEIHALGAPAATGVPADFQPGPARELPGQLRVTARLAPVDTQPGDHFGTAVAMAGDEAWMAAAKSDATAKNGGVIYRSRRDESGAWRITGRLPVNAAADAQLGTSLALTPLAGAAGGNGAAWLFTRDSADGDWSAISLECPGGAAGTRFGQAVAILDFGKSSYVAANDVARLSKVESAVAVSAPGRGAVFLYELPAGKLSATLSPNDSEGFGHAVAAAADKLVISDADGQVFTFLRDAAGGWSQHSVLDGAGLKLPAGARFGHALALSPDGAWLAVSARADAKEGGYGAVFLFAAENGTWTLFQTCPGPDDGMAETEFGSALLFCGPQRLLISAPAAAIEGRRTGGLQLMVWSAADKSWQRARFIAPEDGSQEGHFGSVLVTEGDAVWVGAPDDHGDHANGGSVWQFTLPHCEWQRFETEMPDGFIGTSVALRGGLAAAGSPGRDARSHAGSAQIFQRDAARELWIRAGAPRLEPVPSGSFAAVAWAGERLWSTEPKAVHRYQRGTGGAWPAGPSLATGVSFNLAADDAWLAIASKDAVLFAASGGETATAPARVPGDFHPTSAVAVHGGNALAALADAERCVAAFSLTADTAAPWSQYALLTAPPDARWFGRSVALHGDTALIGAPASDRTGAGHGDGQVHVFQRRGRAWNLAHTLQSPVLRDMPAFGCAVALDGDLAIVGNPRIADGLSHGAVEVFRRDAAGHWHHDRTLEASNAAPGDGFGCHVALHDGWAMIGAKSPHVYFFRFTP